VPAAKRKVYLVMQNAWDTDYLTMPLALGYIKAFALADPTVAESYDIRLFNYQRRMSVSQMAIELFEDPPDIIGFSVLGWNFRNFGQLAETYRQVKPDGWCVFGGNHASHQAQRVMRLFPAVDIVANGEGEHTFRELLLKRLDGATLNDLGDVAGISVKLEGGEIVTTAERRRMVNLDEIPSPFLTGAIPMHGPKGNFLYDVALMETNRGCPYSCAFCYWGGAIGQKIYQFSRDRLREELEYFAANRVENICLCDANFGILKSDIEFVEDLVGLRARCGYPRNLVSSWAKNKSGTFYEIVRILKETGFHSDFTLSLQTLSDNALELMQRKNMKLNDFEDLCDWLRKEGMDTHAELIWGVPGETPESFVDGYDRLARHMSRIATYPLCILPNTTYAEQRDTYEMVTIRDMASDYEFVLSHSTLPLKENRRMHRFLFWARVIGEYQVLRHVWQPLLRLGGVRQSEVMLSLDAFFDGRSDVVSAGLKLHLDTVVHNFDITRVPGAAIYTYLYERELGVSFAEWWEREMLPRMPETSRALLRDVLRWDWFTRPVYDSVAEEQGLPVCEMMGNRYYVREEQFEYDVPAYLARCRELTDVSSVSPEPRRVKLYFRAGFSNVADSHEFIPRYVGKSEAEVLEEEELRKRGWLSSSVQPHVVGIATNPSAVPERRRLVVARAGAVRTGTE
jgi:radical SAM superfamily enzyme YgiQ (UPF0313 family)